MGADNFERMESGGGGGGGGGSGSPFAGWGSPFGAGGFGEAEGGQTFSYGFSSQNGGAFNFEDLIQQAVRQQQQRVRQCTGLYTAF